jgi:hypothetical protein
VLAVWLKILTFLNLNAPIGFVKAAAQPKINRFTYVRIVYRNIIESLCYQRIGGIKRGVQKLFELFVERLNHRQQHPQNNFQN